jgi:citrate synthase
LRILAEHAPGIIERPLPINVSGAIPAAILDAGWPLEAIKAVPLLARTAGLAAHLYEESLRSIGFIMSHKADLAIGYDGATASHPKTKA